MSPVMLELEKGGEGVIGNEGWHDQIDQEITSELRKYRTYRANSIRDLLRAFRNKVSHIKSYHIIYGYEIILFNPVISQL